MDAEQILDELKRRIADYIQLKTEWLKLTAYEKIAKIFATLSLSIILVVLGSFAMLFVFISLGFYIGELTGSFALGFLSVFLLFMLVLVMVICCKKSIQNKVANAMIKSFREEDDKEVDINKEETE